MPLYAKVFRQFYEVFLPLNASEERHVQEGSECPNRAVGLALDLTWSWVLPGVLVQHLRHPEEEWSLASAYPGR